MIPLSPAQRCILAAILTTYGPKEVISALRDLLEEYVLGVRDRKLIFQELCNLSAAARELTSAAAQLDAKKG